MVPPASFQFDSFNRSKKKSRVEIAATLRLFSLRTFHIFDETLSFDQHIKQVCKSSFVHLRNISKIRKYLTKESLEVQIHAFATSKLDYCNSLLYVLSKSLLRKLQSVQNSAAHIITLSRKYDHITPVLTQLHWLPVHFRIVFKILLLVYKCLNGMCPIYLANLLHY